MPKKPPTPTTPTTTPLITSLGMLAPVNAAPILPGGIQPITPMQSNALSIPGTRPMGTIAPPITAKPRLGKIKPTKKLSQSQIAGKKNAEKIMQQVEAGFDWSDVPATVTNRAKIELKAMDEVTRNAIPGMATFFGGLAADIKGLTYNKLLKGEEYSPKTMLQLAEDVQWLGGAVYDASGDNPYRGWFALEREFYDAAATGKPLTPPALRFGGTVSMVGAPLAKVASMGARGAALAAEAGAAEAASAGLISDAARFSRPAGSVVSEGAMAAKPGLSRAAQGLATTSKGLSTVTRVGAQTMMMPLRPYTYAAGKLGSLVRNGTYLGNGVLAWGKKAAMIYREQAKTLVDSGLDIRDPQVSDLIRKAERHERWSNGWRLRREAATYARQANDEAAKVSRAITDETTKPEFAEKFGELTPEENQAVISVIDGHTQLLDHLSRTYNIPLALLTVLGRYNAFPKYWLSPEATALAADFLNGGKNMTPEQYSRMSRVVESVVTALTTQEQMKLEGRGRLRPLAPHHLIPVPIVEYLVRALRAAGRDDLVKFMEDAQDIWELPVEHPDRMDLLRLIIENAPPEVALDSSIYPAPMRPIVEMYRRLRRNLERGAIEAGTGEFPTSPRSGEPGAAARFAEKAKDIANKARERMDKLSEEIARLEERRANSIDKLRRLDIIERYVKGETAEALAKEYGIDIKGMNRILANSGLVRAKREMVALYENYKQVLARAEQMGVADGVTMEQLQAEIDIIEQKAQKIKGDYDIEMKRLQDERQALDDEVQIIDTEEDALTEEMFDAEDDYVANGGDIRELESPDPIVDEITATGGPSEAEQRLSEINDMIASADMEIEAYKSTLDKLESEKVYASSPENSIAELPDVNGIINNVRSQLEKMVQDGSVPSSALTKFNNVVAPYQQPNPKKSATNRDKIAFNSAKTSNKGGILVNKDSRGNLWWTDGYSLYKVIDTPILLESVKEPGVYKPKFENIEDTRKAGSSAFIPEPESAGRVPSFDGLLEAYYKNRDEYKQLKPTDITFTDKSGKYAIYELPAGKDIPAQYVAISTARIDAAGGQIFEASSPTKSILIINHENQSLFGIIMPLTTFDAAQLPKLIENSIRQAIPKQASDLASSVSVAGSDVQVGRTLRSVQDINSEISVTKGKLSEIETKRKDLNNKKLDAYAEIADAEKRLQQPAKPAEETPEVKKVKQTAKSIVDDLGGQQFGGRAVVFDGGKYSSKKAIDKGYVRPPDSVAQINFVIGENEPIYAVASIPIYENTKPENIVRAANQLLESLQVTKEAINATQGGRVHSNKPTQDLSGRTSSYLSITGLSADNKSLILERHATVVQAVQAIRDSALNIVNQPGGKLAPVPAAQPAEITEPSALLRHLDEIVKSTPYVDELVAENAELNTREIEKGLGNIDRLIDEYVKLNTTPKTETFAKDNKNKKLKIGAAPGNQRAVVLRRAYEVGRAIYASTPFVGNISENTISYIRSVTPEWRFKDPNLPPSKKLRGLHRSSDWLEEELLRTLDEYAKIRLEIRTARDIKGASGTSKKISSMKIEADRLKRSAAILIRQIDYMSRQEYYYRAILDHLDGKWEEVSARIRPEDMPAPETAPRLAEPEAATNPRVAELEAKAAEIQKAIDELRDEDDYYSNEGWDRHEYLRHELAVVKAEIETYSQPISESDIMKFRQEHGGIPGKGWKRGETEWYTRSEMIREGEGPGYYTPENVNKGDLEPSRLHDWEAADFVENNPSDGIFVHISKASKGFVNGASPDVYISVPPTWTEFKERIENSISSQSQASENTWVRHHYVGNTKEEGAVTPALKKLLAYVEKKIADGETTIYEPNAAVPAPTTAPRLAEPAKRQATWSEVLPNAVENAKKTAGKSITILKGDGDYKIISGTPSSLGENPSRIEVRLDYGDPAFSNTEVFNQYMSDPVIRLRVLDFILEEMPKLAEQVFARTGNYETFNIELSDVLNPEDYSPEAADYVDKNSYPYATPVVAYVAVINTGGFKKTVSLPEFIDTIQSIRDEVARSIGGTEQTPSLRPPSAPQNVPSQQVSISAELNAKLAQAEDIYTKIESGLINERDARDALEAIDETLTDEERRQLQGPLQPIVANIAEKLSSEEIGKTIHVFADKYRFSVVSNANTDTARMGGHRGNEKSYDTDGTYVVFYLWPHAGNLLPTYDINQRKIPFTTVDDAINAIDQIIEKLPELYAKAAKKSGTDSYTRFEIYPDSQFKTKYGTEVAGVTLLNQGAFKKTTSLDEMITALRRVQEELRNSKSQEIPGLRVPETRQIPARPEDIVPDMSIEDPRVRDYVYESDLLKSLFAEQEQAYREAQTAKEKMKALADLIDAMQKNKEAYQKFTELLNKHKQSRVNLLKIPEQIAKKQSQQQAQQERAEKYSAIAEGIMGSDQMRLLNEMPYNIPLEVAMDPNVVYPGSVERQFMVPDESGGRLVNPIGPSYVPSQRPSTSAGGLPSYEARSGLSGWSKDRSENRRYGDREHIFDLNIVANRLAETAGVMTENEAMRLIVAQHGVNVVDILTPEVVERLIDESTREAKNMPTEAQQSLISDIPDDFIPGIGAETPGVRSPARNLEFAIRKILGAKIIDQMKLRGYTPIDPFGKLGKRFMDYEVTQDTNFVPQYVPSAIARVTSILNPRDMNIILRSASAINRAFKTSTLAFSLMWQIGDLTTAVILAKMTGVDVGTMIARMKQVYEAEYGSARSMFDPNATPTVNEYGRLALQSGVQDVSSSTAEWALRRGLPRAKERPRLSQRLRDRSRMLKPAAKFAQGVEFLADRQFKINETINRITRHAFFLENLDRILKEKGTDLDTVVADGSWKTDMEIRKAVQDAAISANKWLGDFTDLTIAERQYISLAFPFYAWIKHIHKVFWALGKEHPESLAWYMYMGTLGSDTENDPLDLRLGTIPVFGGAASVNFLNPLADVFEGPIGGLLQGNIRPLGRATGPVPRLLGAGLLGTDIASGRSLTSPAGTGMYTETGMPMQGLFSPLDTSTWDRGAGYALQQFPIATRLMSLLPTGEIPGTNIATGPVLRYSTGEARLKPGTNRPVQQYGGQLASLGRLFSIPFIPSRTDEQIADVYKSARIRLKSLEKLKAKAEAND